MLQVTTDLQEKLDYSIDKDDQKIKVQAYFKPLLLDTMNTDLNDTVCIYSFFEAKYISEIQY